MVRILSFSLVAVSGVLLASCSSTPPTATTAPAAATPATAPTQVSRVDSLNGIPGHRFGDPLSAFPGLVAVPSAPGELQRYRYNLLDKREAGWFGKHRAELYSTYYYFQDGKFAGFEAAAYGPGLPVLDREVVFLLGTGSGAATNVHWTGQQAQAAYHRVSRAAQLGQQLEIFSVPALAVQQHQTQTQLQAENTTK